MAFSARDKHEIGKAFAKLVDRLTAAEEMYARLSKIQGRAAIKALPRMNRLSDEIASLRQRIETAERAMEAPSGD